MDTSSPRYGANTLLCNEQTRRKTSNGFDIAYSCKGTHARYMLVRTHVLCATCNIQQKQVLARSKLSIIYIRAGTHNT